jgi:zinc protease
MTLEEHRALAQKYIVPDIMIYLVAGDAKTQFEKLKKDGFKEAVIIDRDGNPVD